MADISPELKALQDLQLKLEASGDKTAKEIKAIADEQVKKEAEVKALVDDLNKQLAAQQLTIKDALDEVKEIKASKGRPVFSVPTPTSNQMVEYGIVKTVEEHKAIIARGQMTEAKEVKAVGVITDSNFTGTNAPYRGYLDWRPGMEPTGQFRFRSLLRTIQSELDNVSFPRAATPVGEGSFGKQATQTATKAQVDRDYAMIDVLCKPMAGWSIVSRAALRNTIFLQSWLPTSLMEQLEDSEDTYFANALVAAATGSTSTTGINNPTEVIPRLVAYMKNNIAAKYNPGTIAMDPNVWANLILNKETNAGFNTPNVVTVDAQGNTRVLGRIMQPVNWLTGNRILGGDWTKAAIVQVEGMTMRQTDSHAEIFTANQIAFLLERIEELATFRPDAFFTAVLT